ncbi:hypothetical protein TcWFU_004106 [Taenia crassiceps]|uniref:Uncharacterized protein n=1 Tax=Taenia crassiceps TaxID=6207 RepID=A0ABR4QQQ4_9CEST
MASSRAHPRVDRRLEPRTFRFWRLNNEHYPTNIGSSKYGCPFCLIRKVAFWSDRKGLKGRRNQSFSEVIVISLLYAFIVRALISLAQHPPLKSRRPALRWLLVGGNCLILLITIVKAKIGYHSLDFIVRKRK